MLCNVQGGWGWVITACAVLVQILTTGVQFSFGILYIHILRVFGPDNVMSTGNLENSLMIDHRLYSISLDRCSLSLNQLRLHSVPGGFLQVQPRWKDCNQYQMRSTEETSEVKLT